MRIQQVMNSAREWLYRRAFWTLAAAWLLSYLPWCAWFVHRLMARIYRGEVFLSLDLFPVWVVVNIVTTMLLLFLFFWGHKAPLEDVA